MFYLLEDNTIIDSENIRKDLAFDMDVFIENNEVMFINNRNHSIIDIVGIKNKSNNIFNLVECCQDLIETKDGQFYKPLKLQIDSFVVKYDCCVMFNDIVAIYKPNSNGDYIKVWEKKDD